MQIAWTYLLVCCNIFIINCHSQYDVQQRGLLGLNVGNAPRDENDLISLQVGNVVPRGLLGVNVGTNAPRDENDLISLQVRQKDAQSSEWTEDDTAGLLWAKYISDNPRQESWGKKQREEYYKVTDSRDGPISGQLNYLERRLAWLKALKKENDKVIERLKLAKRQRKYDDLQMKAAPSKTNQQQPGENISNPALRKTYYAGEGGR